MYQTLQCFDVGGEAQERKDEQDLKDKQKAKYPPLWTDLFRSSGLIAIVILLLNGLILRLMLLPGMDHGLQVGCVVFGFQGLLYIGMRRCFYQTFRPSAEPIGNPEDQERSAGFEQTYICSLYYSVLVMSLIPAMGLLWYGWSVEKIQFVRSDELHIATLNVDHMKYVARQILPQTKPAVMSGLEGNDPDYKKNLLYDTGNYLPTEKIRYSVLPTRQWLAPDRDTTHDPDQPYINFLDELFLLTSGEYNSYSVAAKAADSSWIFKTFLPDSIRMYRSARYDSVMGVGVRRTACTGFHGEHFTKGFAVHV